MKNILIVHSSLAGGGAERILIEYLKKLDSTQYNITLLLVLNSYLQHYLSEVPSKIKVVFITEKQRFSKFDWILYRIGLHSIIEKKQLNKLGLGSYDIIISFMEGDALKYHSNLHKRAKRNITWVHIDFEKLHWSKMFFKSQNHECKIYNKMSDIVFVSEDAKNSFNKIFKINDQINQEVINNPINNNRIINASFEFDVKKNKFTVIGIGRLQEQKRFDRFIDVAKLLSDRNIDIEFWILGSGKLEGKLKDKAKKLGVMDKIVFKGFVENPYPHLKVADVLLLTSDVEGYPTVICESLVLGTPVVMTRVSGANELLGNSEYGIITNDMTPEVIALDIERLYSDKELYESYKLKSLNRATLFHLDKILDKIQKLL